MLAVAQSVPSSGAAIGWHEANAESLPLPDGSFDVVVSSLGLQFVADKTSALREMRRVLAPEGRLAIATVGPTPPLFAILEQALARHVKPEVAAFVQAVFSLYKPQELESLTSSAGFRNADVRSETLSLTLPEPREFLWQYVHSTPLAAAVAQIDDEARAALERDVVAGCRSFVKVGILEADISVVLTTRLSVTASASLANVMPCSLLVTGSHQQTMKDVVPSFFVRFRMLAIEKVLRRCPHILEICPQSTAH